MVTSPLRDGNVRIFFFFGEILKIRFAIGKDNKIHEAKPARFYFLQTVTDRVDIPPTASAQGKCGPFVNILTLAWSQGNLTFLFIKKPIYVAGNDTGMGSYSLNGIFGSVVTPNSFAANASGLYFLSLQKKKYFIAKFY